MNLRFVLDESNNWVLCFEVNETEKELLLGKKSSINLPYSLHLTEFKPGLLRVSTEYFGAMIGPNLFESIKDFLESKVAINTEQATEFQKHYEEFYSIYKDFKKFTKDIPKRTRLEHIFAHNNPSSIMIAFNKEVNKFQKVPEGLEKFRATIDKTVFLTTDEKQNFHTLIDQSLIKLTTIEKNITRRVEEKIQFLDKDPNYIENIKPEKRFAHIISHLKPLEQKENFLKNLLLDEQSSMARYRLKEGPGFPIFQEGIKSITLYSQVSRDPHQKTPETNASEALIYHDASARDLFEIVFANGKKAFYEIDPNIVSSDMLAEIFINHGANADYSSYSRGVGPLLDFFREGLSGYDKEIEADYQTIHKQLALQVANVIHNEKAVEITFIGCGKGEEVKLIADLFNERKIPYRIYAIDIDPGNIEAAKNNLSGYKNILFKADNAINIDQFISEGRLKHANFYKTNPLTIAISSGCLTREVNKDQTEAFDIFKKVGHYIDKIFISGRTATLIVKRDAKKAGFDNQQTFYKSPEESSESLNRTLDSYTFKDSHEQAKKILLSSNKEINLTEHARPLSILKEMDSLTKKDKTFWQGKTINLNDAYLAQDEIKKLAKFAYNHDLTIAINGSEPWLPALQTKINKLSTGRFQMFKTTHHVEFVKVDQIKTTKMIHKKIEITERPKISDKLRERALDSLDEERANKNKPR